MGFSVQSTRQHAVCINQTLILPSHWVPTSIHKHESGISFWQVPSEYLGLRAVKHITLYLKDNRDEWRDSLFFKEVNDLMTYWKQHHYKALMTAIKLSSLSLDADCYMYDYKHQHLEHLLECPWARFRSSHAPGRLCCSQAWLLTSTWKEVTEKRLFLGSVEYQRHPEGMLWTIRIPNIPDKEWGRSLKSLCNLLELYLSVWERWMRWDRWNSIDFTYTRPAAYTGVLSAYGKSDHSFFSHHG